MGIDRQSARTVASQVKCKDDCVAPDDWYLCDRDDLHAGDHEARGAFGRVLKRWPRGKGRALGEWRRHFGIGDDWGAGDAPAIGGGV